MGSVRDLTSGGCGAWSLPGDLSSAATARRVYQEAATEVGISADLAYDGMTMASELAANTLHSVSQHGAAALLRLGHAEVYSLAGGIDAWSLEVDPLVPRY